MPEIALQVLSFLFECQGRKDAGIDTDAVDVRNASTTDVCVSN